MGRRNIFYIYLLTLIALWFVSTTVAASKPKAKEDAIMQNFRLFQTAIMFFKKCKCVSMPRHLREQLDRASASISCNIGEGYGRISKLDKRRFYRIALALCASMRECRTLLILAEHEDPELMGMLDFLGGGLYKLSR